MKTQSSLKSLPGRELPVTSTTVCIVAVLSLALLYDLWHTIVFHNVTSVGITLFLPDEGTKFCSEILLFYMHNVSVKWWPIDADNWSADDSSWTHSVLSLLHKLFLCQLSDYVSTFIWNWWSLPLAWHNWLIMHLAIILNLWKNWYRFEGKG